MVTSETAKLQEIKFTTDLCCQTCAVPRETCSNSVYFSIQGKKECLYSRIVQEAVAAIMVISPNMVVEKMYMWMQSEEIWSASAVLGTEDVEQVT